MTCTIYVTSATVQKYKTYHIKRKLSFLHNKHVTYRIKTMGMSQPSWQSAIITQMRIPNRIESLLNFNADIDALTESW